MHNSITTRKILNTGIGEKLHKCTAHQGGEGDTVRMYCFAFFHDIKIGGGRIDWTVLFQKLPWKSRIT